MTGRSTSQAAPDGGPPDVPPIVPSSVDELVPERVRSFAALLERSFHDLIGLPAAQLDEGLVSVLGSVTDFLGADRGYVVRYDHDQRTTSMTHEWCAPGVPSAFDSEQGRSFDDFPQEQARLFRHEVNDIRDVRELDAEWELDARYLAEEGITAIIELPFFADGRVAGLIGFDRVSGPATWVDDDIPVLRSVAALAEHVFNRTGDRPVVDDPLGRLGVFERSPIAIVVVDDGPAILDLNERAAELFGRTRGELTGAALVALVHPDDVPNVVGPWAVMRAGVSSSCSAEVRLGSVDDPSWCRLDLLADRLDDGTFVGATVHIWDTSSQRHVVDALARTEARYESLVAALPEAIIQIDPSGAPSFVNQAALDLRDRLLAAGVEDVGGWPVLPGEAQSAIDLHLRRSLTEGRRQIVEFELPTEDGPVWLECSMLPQGHDAGDPSLLLILRDTTESHLHRDELEHQASHDHLTGLPNRVAFLRALDAASGRIGGDLESIGVLFVDLDDFKVVNDSLGHDAGDALLVIAAGRLRRRLGSDHFVARFGGDEFTVLAADVTDADLVELADRVRSALGEPATYDGRRFVLAASVGVIRADRRTDPADLLRWADAALYEAKAGGRDRVAVVDDALRGRVADRTALGLDLKVAAEAEQLVTCFQPEVDLTTGRVVGAEALVRWQHPVRGLLQPGAFVDLAEENGSIAGIGRWVLEQSCRTAAAWVAAGTVDDDFVIRVNVSVRQLELADFAEQVAEALERSGLEPHRLTLEVTETTVMRDAELGLVSVNRLRDLGVRLAIDDFGTGYSSLQLLKRLPIDVVKIDRSFVAGLPGDLEDAAIVETVLRLAEVLGLGVTAEGVERSDQLDALVGMGCRSAQGFLFSPPVPSAEFESLLRSPTWDQGRR